MKLDEIYPEHFGALSKVDLLKNYDTPALRAKVAELKAALEDEVRQAKNEERKRQEKSDLLQS
jgi:hypothetical protein